MQALDEGLKDCKGLRHSRRVGRGSRGRGSLLLLLLQAAPCLLKCAVRLLQLARVEGCCSWPRGACKAALVGRTSGYGSRCTRAPQGAVCRVALCALVTCTVSVPAKHNPANLTLRPSCRRSAAPASSSLGRCGCPAGKGTARRCSAPQANTCNSSRRDEQPVSARQELPLSLASTDQTHCVLRHSCRAASKSGGLSWEARPANPSLRQASSAAWCSAGEGCSVNRSPCTCTLVWIRAASAPDAARNTISNVAARSVAASGLRIRQHGARLAVERSAAQRVCCYVASELALRGCPWTVPCRYLPHGWHPLHAAGLVQSLLSEDRHQA